MCGRFTLTGRAGRLSKRFEVEVGPDGTGRYNIAPGQQILTVVRDADGRRSELMRWGLVPSWAKEESIGYKMINARAESVLDKRSYKPLIESAEHRCLVLADGFYEWLKPEDPKAPKVPMRFVRKDGEPFAFAGLWTAWQSPQGETVPSCTIVTTKSNSVVAPVHDRMPVIFPGAATESAWLDPQVAAADAQRLLVPLAAAELTASPASRRVNSVKNDDPAVLDVDATQVADDPNGSPRLA